MNTTRVNRSMLSQCASSRTRRVFMCAAAAIVLFAVVSCITAALMMNRPLHAYALTSPDGDELTPLTRETLDQVRKGLIPYKDGTIDTLLYAKLNPDPEADPDGDGLKTNQELFTYQKDGKTYLYYASHPMIEDTDGDGYPDKTDSDPLSWNVSARDAVLMMKLAYRDDDYIQKVLDDNRYFSAADCYEGNACYKLMHNEWSHYWKFTRSWHEGDGTDVALLEFSNKRYPFLKDKSVHLLGFRGTEGRGDLGTDLALAFGVFPAQAHSTVKIADEINQMGTKNTYVAGHSLGGFLSQVFLVRSVGNPYGPPEMNDAHDNLNYWDKNKKENPEIKQIFTFNAPALSKKGGSTWLKEYSYMGDTLTKRFNSKHYVTANDSVSKMAGRMEGAIILPASQAGHKSDSFFEAKYTDVEGFSVGKRRGLNHVGYHNDLTDLCHFVKPTKLKMYDERTGNLLIDKVFACTEENAKTIDTSRLVPDGYDLVTKPDPFKYGEENVFVISPHKITLTYVFKDGDKVVHQDELQVPYKESYTAPSLPKHQNEDYEYILAPDQQITQLKPEEVVENRTFEVKVVERAVTVKTLVNLVDADGKTVKTVEYTTKPSEKDAFDVQPSDLPEGYEFADNDRQVKPGTNRDVKIVKKAYTLTYRYVDEHNVALKTEDEKVEHGETSTYEPKAPEGYVFKQDYKHTPPTNVVADKTYDIPVEPKPAETHTVTLVFVQKTDAGTKEVTKRSLSIKHGDKVPAQDAPIHEKSAEGYAWKIVDNESYKQVITADTTIDIPVDEEAPAQPAPPQVYTVLVKYVYNNTVIKEETQKVPEGQQVVVQVPTSSKGVYTAQTDGVTLTPHENTTITIPMTFEKRKVKVVREYVDEANTVVSSDTIEVPVDTAPPVPKEIVQNEKLYRVNEDYQAPVVTEDVTLRIPVHSADETTEKHHVLNISYYEGDKLLKTDVGIIVQDGQYPPIELPDVVDGRDGSYVLMALPDPITKSGELRIEMLFEPTRYPVHMKYVDKNTEELLKEDFLEVETGSKPTANIDGIDGGYKVDPAFEMPTVTSEREVVVPLVKEEPNTPGDDNPAPDPAPEPAPDPTPGPTPEPTPDSTPEPTVDPAPTPTVDPAPDRAPLASAPSQPASPDAVSTSVPATHDLAYGYAAACAVCGLVILFTGAVWYRRRGCNNS